MDVSNDPFPRDEVTGLAAFENLEPVSALNVMPEEPAPEPELAAQLAAVQRALWPLAQGLVLPSRQESSQPAIGWPLGWYVDCCWNSRFPAYFAERPAAHGAADDA